VINDKFQIGISVDAITHEEKNKFILRLIPDFNSLYFPPFHTRQVYVLPELLEKQYLDWIKENHPLPNFNFNSGEATGSIVQGGYYIIEKNDLKKLSLDNEPLGTQNNIFKENIGPSLYKDEDIAANKILNADEINELNVTLSSDNCENCTYLYGFYVGHGDTLLLITSAKNAYLIDTNFYEKDDMDIKINKIKTILAKHNMNDKKIKGLIITHKHSDHIRGADQLIKTKAFTFDYFIINKNYPHYTQMAINLLNEAKNIPCWINLINPCTIIEGNTVIYFKNPYDKTFEAHDINDSSIVMHVTHGKNNIYLTGDACFSILQNVFNNPKLNISSENLLKVSHHGSRTGTDDNLIKTLKPKKAFISVGYKYQYKNKLPHNECENALKVNNVHKILSRDEKMTIEYRCDGKKIKCSYIP